MIKRMAVALAAGVAGLMSMAGVAPSAGAATDIPVAVTPYSGADPSLTRAPYVTDLTQTSADVTWATGAPATSAPGTLEWGTPGNCTANQVAVPSTLPNLVPLSGSPSSATSRQFTVGSVSEYQSTVTISGLQAGTTYCYRPFTGGSSPVDLLGTNAAPTFTTLDAVGSSAPLTFDVVGDLGETNYSTGTDFAGTLNTDQAAIDSLIGKSGAKFVVTAGDVAYSGGTQTDYGDLQQTGSEVSDIFGPSYWPETGGLPTFGAVGNHGQNVDGLRVWPESNTTAASSGAYDFNSYPADSAAGVPASTEPAAWYAISTGNVRIYVLDASWGDSNVGTSNLYQVDYDQHWTPSSPEYQWLAADLASHPGGVKMAVFHFPLRSDNSTQASDTLLQNSSANPNASTSLEALLSHNGVSIAFNGHAHTYQRINPHGAGQITNYVTGGGGAVLEPVNGGATCTALLATEDIYALGWSPSGAGPTSGSGSACGPPGTPTPQSAADVYNFLKVTVTGTTVVVDPTNAAGQVFDPHTYTPSGNSASPSAPGSVTALALSPSSVQVSWSPSTEAGGTIKNYQIDRDGSSLGSVTGTTFVDNSVEAGTTYTYSVTAVDNVGALSSPGLSNPVTTPGSPSLPFSGPPLGPVVNNCMSHLPAGSVVGSAALPDGSGYYEVDAQGDVAAFGGAVCFGALTGTPLNRPIVGMAIDPA
ncbi:MAG TPA: fibronectin type III domain-containing protein, partial [Acidimicrobiales bacterium]